MYQHFRTPFLPEDATAPETATSSSSNLSEQALDESFESMKIAHLVQLSVYSKEFARYANDTIRKRCVFPWKLEVIAAGGKEIIRVISDQNFKVEWEVINGFVYNDPKDFWKVASAKIVLIPTDRGFCSHRFPTDPHGFVLYNIFVHLMVFFPVVIKTLELDITNDKGFLTRLKDSPTLCENLVVCGTLKDTRFWKGAEWVEALASITVSEKLTINATMPEDFVLPKSLETRCLYIKRGDWILNNLFNIGSKFCRLEILDVCNLRKFIAEFMSSRIVPKLEWLTVDLNGKKPSISDLFLKFGAQEWDPSRRDGYFTQFHGESLEDIDCRFGLDIERQDGLLATIFHKSSTPGAHQFHFILWHERFRSAANMKKKIEMMEKLSFEEEEQKRIKIAENERRIKENEEKTARMELEINELWVRNCSLKLNPNCFDRL